MNIDRQAVAELVGETREHTEWMGASITRRMKGELRMVSAVWQCSQSVVIREAVAHAILEAKRGAREKHD